MSQRSSGKKSEKKNKNISEILEMALVGYQQKHDKAKPQRKMSAAARKRISTAQKKRWAEYKKRKKAGK
jgi:hypothetical protein